MIGLEYAGGLMTGTGGSSFNIMVSSCTLAFVRLLWGGFIMWFYYVVLLCGFQKTIKCLSELEI